MATPLTVCGVLSRRNTQLYKILSASCSRKVNTPYAPTPVNPEAYEDRWAITASEKYTKVSEVHDRWKFVERLLPAKEVPEPPEHEQYPTPSGWRPPSKKPPRLPYFIRRTRNHMLPVYEEVEIRGPRYITVVKQVEGNIRTFEKELREFVEKLSGKTDIPSRVHETACYVGVKGRYVEEVKEWLYSKGF